MNKLLLVLLISFSALASNKVLFLGDSLTAGYGIDPEKAYPNLVRDILKKEGIEITVMNASISGSTSASAVSRLKWSLRGKPDVMLLALGANDGLRGIKLHSTKDNLKKAIKLAKSKGVKVILAGMQIPPNYGPEYTKEFKKMFPDLKKEEGVTLLPFLLKDVAGQRNLNLDDGIHPNEEGHKIIAKTVAPFIKGAL
ncbi:arylesterase [Halobacteriovorax vibrionivorans]|uniref:Arylesterase n=1 Tax=Halobacteriovorax vibrionivorans TaxID=2152716 RepID=A0ABY0IEQ7_9BACT|nr:MULTISPECIES: arylesterase [Halobacteriovorax]RZF21430.1 arylesterase [Halobacteriovorax vibrionivorans]TGD48702.1 arylesterase [Halobacteriovorax sp. Y22]